jgi:hypothetical protein
MVELVLADLGPRRRRPDREPLPPAWALLALAAGVAAALAAGQLGRRRRPVRR